MLGVQRAAAPVQLKSVLDSAFLPPENGTVRKSTLDFLKDRNCVWLLQHGGGCSSVVERMLSMHEVLGSIPSISRFFDGWGRRALIFRIPVLSLVCSGLCTKRLVPTNLLLLFTSAGLVDLLD